MKITNFTAALALAVTIASCSSDSDDVIVEDLNTPVSTNVAIGNWSEVVRTDMGGYIRQTASYDDQDVIVHVGCPIDSDVYVDFSLTAMPDDNIISYSSYTNAEAVLTGSGVYVAVPTAEANVMLKTMLADVVDVTLYYNISGDSYNHKFDSTGLYQAFELVCNDHAQFDAYVNGVNQPAVLLDAVSNDTVDMSGDIVVVEVLPGVVVSSTGVTLPEGYWQIQYADSHVTLYEGEGGQFVFLAPGTYDVIDLHVRDELVVD